MPRRAGAYHHPVLDRQPVGRARHRRHGGCIRDKDHAYTVEGGLCVLRGNLAQDGAVLKTAGIDEDLWHFEGPARVVESQEEAVQVILSKTLQAGEVLVVRYEGPSGGPGMQEMLHPTAS